MLHISRQIAGLQGFRPVVLTQKREGDFAADSIHIVPRSPWRFLSRYREKQTSEPWQISRSEAHQLQEVLEQHECALLHVFFGNSAIHLLPLLRELTIPFVVSFHGSDVAGSMASVGYASSIKELFHLAAAIPCRSEQLAGRVKLLGAAQGKLRLMRTVLPDLTFVQRQAPPDGAWRVVQAARLVKKKGIDISLRAFAEFHRNHPLATFVIAGEGPLRSELEDLAGELGIASAVRFAGFLGQADLQQLFADSHLFLHPSLTAAGDVEGVPNSMLEAMAAGLPVIATEHGGIPEVIQNDRNGILCPEGDVQAVAHALTALAGDPARYARLSSAGAASVRDQFSSRRGIAAIEDLYREVILAHRATQSVKLRPS